MKTDSKKMSSLFVGIQLMLGFCLSLGLATGAQAQGQGTGNGGDGIQLEVIAITKALGRMLQRDEKTNPRKFPEVASERFLSIGSTLKVKSYSGHLVDYLGDEKTAVNFTDKNGDRIVRIQESKYRSLPTVIRQQIVFHEVLGLMGLEKSNQSHISSRLDVQVERPVYGTCKVSYRNRVFSLGVKFDTSTRTLEGAYVERSDDSSVYYIGGSLEKGKYEFKSVRVWQGYGANTEGFRYKDEWIEIEVATPPFPGVEVDLAIKRRQVSFNAPDKWVQLKGKCELMYD